MGETAAAAVTTNATMEIEDRATNDWIFTRKKAVEAPQHCASVSKFAASALLPTTQSVDQLVYE